MELNPIIEYLVNDVKLPKSRIANMLGCDPKTVRHIIEDKEGYQVVKIPRDRVMRSGTSLEEAV